LLTAKALPDSTSSRITKHLIRRIGKNKFNLWFGAAHLGYGAEGLIVTVANRFTADWIDSHYHDHLLRVAEQELGEGAAVDLNVEPSMAATSEAAPATTAHPNAQAPVRPITRTASASDGRHRLEDMVIGPFNELAVTTARRMVEEADHPVSALFVHGDCGLGKTHLLQGICRRFAERCPTGKWLYLSAEQFVNRYVQSVRSNSLSHFRKRLRGLDLLAVDDVQLLANKSATQNEFQHTFDEIALNGARILLASDSPPKMIRALNPSLMSRFLSGMVVRIDTADRPTLARIVTAMARRRGLILQEAAAEALSERVTSIREAEGLVTKLAAVVRLSEPRRRPGDPIGLDAVRRLLAEEGRAEPTSAPIRLEHIVKTVASSLGVETSKIYSPSRHRRVVMARSLAIYLARQLTTMSYPELARALNRSNHSTIVTAAQRVERQIKQQQLAGLIESPHATVDYLAETLCQKVRATAGGSS
jgi:chromosomal replication initiator protein